MQTAQTLPVCAVFQNLYCTFDWMILRIKSKNPQDMSVRIGTLGLFHMMQFIYCFSWKKGTSRLPIRPGQSIFSNGTLLITKVENDDVGSYTCVVESDGQTLSSSEAALELACKCMFLKGDLNNKNNYQNATLLLKGHYV